MGLGFFFQEIKIRYTGTLEKIMRQPYPGRKIITAVAHLMYTCTV
jgi:hypothetical protein